MNNEPVTQPSAAPQPTDAQQISSATPGGASVQAAPPQATEQPTQFTAPVQSGQSGGGAKTKIIIAAVVAAILVACGAFFALAVYPGMQARSVASAFMKAVEADDEKKMEDLSGTGKDNVTDRAHDGLQGASYKLTSVDSGDKGFNVHFDVKSSKTLTSTTVVVEKGKVTNFVLRSKTATPADTSKDDSPSPAPAKTASCLTLSDLKSLSYTGIDSLATKQTLESFYFLADSTAYESASLSSSSLKSVAKLYSTFSAKTFSLSVRGAVNEATASAGGSQLATDRANKVKADLVSLGVPADRITIDAPEAGTMDNQTVYRTVTLFVFAPSDCGSTSSASGM
jgi:outer membrane protein OmpA-like peptidoglycan-associated protein